MAVVMDPSQEEAMWAEYVEKEAKVLDEERAKSAEQRRRFHRQRTLETLEATQKGLENEIEERKKKRSDERRLRLEEEMKKMEEEAKKQEEERKAREAERKRRMEEEAERLEYQRNKEREERRKQRDEQMKKEMEEFNAREQERLRKRQERDSAREIERELQRQEEEKKKQEEANLRAEAEKILSEQQAARAQKQERRQKYLQAIDKQRKVILQDRVMTSVPLLENNRLDFEDIFEEVPSTGRVVPRYKLIKEHFDNEGRLDNLVAIEICKLATAILAAEPNIVELTAPLVVFGDIHGQYYDLQNLMKTAGPVDSTQYLFLGDYVDRGNFSVEVVLLLLSIKINFPKSFWLLRGNHESRGVTEYFNFRAECFYKYSEELYEAIMIVFDSLPIAATVFVPELPGTFFCCHGGIGPDVKTLEDVRGIDRFCEPPEDGAYCDLLWADPVEEGSAVGLTPSEMEEWWKVDFMPNTARGTSCVFYYRAALDFCNNNGFVSLIRAHEVQKFGFLEHRFRRKDREHPVVITVFSAPNYCDMYENRAAFIRFTKKDYDFVQCAWVDHPYYLPDFQNVFKFSLTFLAENVTRFCLNILDFCAQDSEEDAEDLRSVRSGTDTEVDADGNVHFSDSEEEVQDNRRSIKEKIHDLGKTMLILQALRMAKQNSLKPFPIFEERYADNLSLFERIVQADNVEKMKPKVEKKPKVVDPRSRFTKIKSSPGLITGKSGSRLLPPVRGLTRQYSTDI